MKPYTKPYTGAQYRSSIYLTLSITFIIAILMAVPYVFDAF
ncbi:hypothetical protein DFP91_5810 [Pseudorhodoplanes sinuspersici]|nr:hypothetical protein DFP91_5810 [Pseudorhodoplanes sinuspersici]